MWSERMKCYIYNNIASEIIANCFTCLQLIFKHKSSQRFAITLFIQSYQSPEAFLERNGLSCVHSYNSYDSNEP